jgi:hypothetical protein
MVMKKCLIDASSAILLFKCDMFQDLLATYRIIMAVSVFKELRGDGYPGARQFKEWVLKEHIIVVSPTEGKFSTGNAGSIGTNLGNGERDTLLCFHAGNGEFIMVDDGKAARHCRNNSIPYINALLFPRILYLADMVAESKYLQRTMILTKIGRYSQDIIDFARNSTKRELSFFLP